MMFHMLKGLKAKSVHFLFGCFLRSWPDFIAFVSAVVCLEEAVSHFIFLVLGCVTFQWSL